MLINASLDCTDSKFNHLEAGHVVTRNLKDILILETVIRYSFYGSEIQITHSLPY